AIDAGTFRQAAAAASVALTLRDITAKYLERHVNVPTRRQHARYSMTLHLKRLCAARVPAAGGTTIALGDKPMVSIVKADVEALRDQLRAEYQKNRTAVAAAEAYAQLPKAVQARTPAPP